MPESYSEHYDSDSNSMPAPNTPEGIYKFGLEDINGLAEVLKDERQAAVTGLGNVATIASGIEYDILFAPETESDYRILNQEVSNISVDLGRIIKSLSKNYDWAVGYWY